jgi:Fic family protein
MVLCLVFFNCSSTKQNDFYKRKYHSESSKSYKEKKGLMLLNNTQLGRNKYMQSKEYQKKLKKSYKTIKK